MVYRKPHPRNRFAQECLAEYAAIPTKAHHFSERLGWTRPFTGYRLPTVGQLNRVGAHRQLPPPMTRGNIAHTITVFLRSVPNQFVR